MVGHTQCRPFKLCESYVDIDTEIRKDIFNGNYQKLPELSYVFKIFVNKIHRNRKQWLRVVQTQTCSCYGYWTWMVLHLVKMNSIIANACNMSIVHVCIMFNNNNLVALRKA